MAAITGFVSLYGLALVAVVAAAVLVTRSPARRGESSPEQFDEYEVAVLNEGEELAAVLALVNLDRQGALELGDGVLRDLADSGDLDLDRATSADLVRQGVGMYLRLGAPLPSDAHPVEAEAYQVAAESQPPVADHVVAVTALGAALADVRGGLIRRGLLYGPDDVERLRRRWRWLLPLLGVGSARLVVDVGLGEVHALLVLAVATTVGIMLAIARRKPERTPSGAKALADLRCARPELAAGRLSAADPGFGLALALGGTALLWGSDRALALAVAPDPAAEIPQPSRSGSSWWAGGGGGGWGGSGWGGGGCGGGGSYGGGSYGGGWGGGGGCGGGGCGGGGCGGG